MESRTAFLLAVSLATLSCVGTVGDPGSMLDPGDSQGSRPDATIPASIGGVPKVGIRRLTKSELQNTIRGLLLGVDPAEFMYAWPIDPRPFDTAYRDQVPSMPLVQAVMAVADGVTGKVTANPTLVATLAGCTPATPSDTSCLRKFITSFGLKALRRPLGPDEKDSLQTLATANATDFADQVGIVIRDLLQDPEFLYLIECGGCTQGATAEHPAAGAPFALSNWEIASRLSYLLWGHPPDPDLLSSAGAGRLRKPEEIRAQAARMLMDPRARARVDRFHAMWFHYEWSQDSLPMPQSMIGESNALFERVIFTNHAPWTDVLRSTETYVNKTLASFYNDGTPGPTAGNGWVKYGSNGRQGFLSHATFLSADSGGRDDTSPTFRGKNLRNLLLCEEIPPPDPSLKVDNSKPPEALPGECKVDRYARSYLRSGSVCVTCHNQMDVTGFGLENYDTAGKFRSTELDNPRCPISGKGKLLVAGELKDFTRPAGLANLLLDSEETRGKIRRCAVRQFFRFAVGRPEDSEHDGPLLDALTDTFQKSNEDFLALLTAFVSSPSFAVRLTDDTQN